MNKVPPAILSQIIHKESKVSNENLFPFPDHWNTGGFEDKYKEIKSALKYSEGSYQPELDLEDLDKYSKTPNNTSISPLNRNKFMQELPVPQVTENSLNDSIMIVYPERTVRNITIFAMLLIASKFGVLLLLNFLMTLISFYISIRYAQMYKEQKEDSNNTQRTTRRTASPPYLFNDFNESSTVSFGQKNEPNDIKNQAPKNQAPNNQNIAFVIPVTKE